MRKQDYETVVIDGEVRLRNTINGDVVDGEFSLRNTIDGEPAEVLKVSEGTRNYEVLINKPRIESIELIGDKTFEELGLSELDGEDLINILRD